MRRVRGRLFALLILAVAGQALGAGPVSKVPRGYVFDQPRILTQQRLFGLAHAVGLLARACEGQAAHREENRRAYAAWHSRQASTIESARKDLARYYFGAQADDADWDGIADALGLSSQLRLKPGSPNLRAACATFAESLGHSDNDLAAQFALQAQLARLSEAEETAAQATACRNQIGDATAQPLSDALRQWHHDNDADVAEARQAIEQRWREAKLAGSLDRWLQQARQSGRTRATAEKCPQLAAWLATPAARPGHEFDD